MKRVEVTIYSIDDQANPNLSDYCQDCDGAIAVTEKILESIADPDVELKIRHWEKDSLRNLGLVAMYPPILLVGGQVVSQGVVPDRKYLESKIREALG